MLLGNKLKSSDSSVKKSSPFPNSDAKLEDDDDSNTPISNQNKFNQLFEFSKPKDHESDNSNISDVDNSLEQEIKQFSDLHHEYLSGVDENIDFEDKEDGDQSNNHDQSNSKEDNNDKLPVDFTDMLDGNQNKDTEKVFYYSTLNSQDKIDNINELDKDQESNQKQRYHQLNLILVDLALIQS